MADYVVRFTGLDNLSGTINQVNKELNQVGNSSTKLDLIMAKFNRIDLSAAPVKRKLRDLQLIMALMNLDGLTGTDLFTIIAEKAGALSDAMGDASTAIRQYSNDTFKLQAGIEAFLGITAAATVATGVMGLLGSENEKVELAILKVQSAMAIMNGVLQIANTLNKDSALMLRLKSIWTAANTTATGANTVATGANTVATIANTAALKAWNYTKAIGKALFGDWTGLVLVGAAALGTYALATSDASDAEKEHNDKLKKTLETMDNYTSTLTSTFSLLMTSYAKLRAEWVNLSNEQQKNQWIKQNQNKLEELNLSINNVADAEKIFSNNTPSVVKAFEARAKAAALLSLLTENYKKQMLLIDKINTTLAALAAYAATLPKVLAGLEITNSSHRSSRYGYVNNAGKWVYSEAGAKLNNTGISDTNPLMNRMKKELESLLDEANKIANNMAETLKDLPTITKKGSTTKPSTTKTGKTAKDVVAPMGSLLALEDELNKLNKELKLTPETDTTKIEELKGKIAELTGKKEALEIKLGLKEPKKEEAKKWAEGSIASIKEEIAKLDDRLLNENLELPVRIKLVLERAELLKKVDELLDAGKPVEIPVKVGGFKGFKENADNIIGGFEGIDGVVNSFESLAQSIADGANAWEIFMGVVQTVSSVLNGVASTILAVTTITELLGTTTAATTAVTTASATLEVANSGMVVAAKSGEAIAGATASGAKMPFPLNLIAIAAGIAAVVGALAMISGGFADGGIIGGNSFHGDRMLARVNAGEMILNQKQLANLFNMLNSGASNAGGTVEFKISGSQLKGVLNNYNSKMNKVK